MKLDDQPSRWFQDAERQLDIEEALDQTFGDRDPWWLALADAVGIILFVICFGLLCAACSAVLAS